MRAEAGVGALEWASAALVAVVLHAAVVLEMPSTRTSIAGRRAGTPEGSTRVRLSLGSGSRAAPAAPAPPAVAPMPAPARPVPPTPPPALATPRPAPPKPRAEPPAPRPVSAPLPGTSAPATPSAASGASSMLSAAAAPAAAPLGEAVGGTESPGARGEDAARGEARGDYFGGIVQRVTAVLSYPRRARLERTEGTVVLFIRVDRLGEIEHIEVVESSGSRTLDRQALRSTRRAAPFGPVPPLLADEDLQFDFPIDFVLKE